MSLARRRAWPEGHRVTVTITQEKLSSPSIPPLLAIITLWDKAAYAAANVPRVPDSPALPSAACCGLCSRSLQYGR